MHISRRVLVFLSVIAVSQRPVWAVEPINCSPTFSECWIPENVLLQLPSPLYGFAGDLIIQKANSTSEHDVFRLFNNLVDTGRGTGLGSLYILYSSDDSELPSPATYSANAITIHESASGTTDYVGNGTLYHLDTSAAPSRLLYTGNTSADYHDPAQLTAVLTGHGATPISGATVKFDLGSQGCTATTNASGVASCSVRLNQAAGNYKVTASFGGIFGAYAGASTSVPFGVTLEQTTLSYTGDTAIQNGGTAQMSGVLLEDNVTPIAGRTVKFTLGTGPTAQNCTASTNPAGMAACTISPVAQPLGLGIARDSFLGDAVYRPASAEATIRVH